MKLTKIQKLGLFSIPVIVGLYLIYRQFAKPKVVRRNIEQKQEAINEVIDAPKTISNPTPNCSYPLKKGLYDCELVKQLQKALNAYPNAPISVSGSNSALANLIEDGDFGTKTQDYLMAVTSELAVGGSSVITYTWATVDNESEFNKLVSEINKAVIASLPYYPGVSVPPAPEPPVVNPFPTYP